MAVALAMPAPAPAQPTLDPGDPRQQEIDAVYALLLDDPTDRTLNRRLAALALELDDIDAAIGAVERLVFLDPQDVALQIEVARLYLRIDSYAAARGYLDDALALPNVTAAQRSEIETLIAGVEEATGPRAWSGFAQVGLRYQTNANVGPTELGEFEQLPVEDPTDDFNAFVLGTLAYADRVSDHLALEASLSGLYAEQFEVDRLDIGFVELQAGPRLFWHDDNLALKPYLLGQGIMLGDDLYQLTYGGGALISARLGEGWSLEPEFEYKKRTFYESDDYLTATDQTGELFSYTLRTIGQISDRTSVAARVTYNRNRAAADFQSYDQVIANLSMTFGFDAFDRTGWQLSPFARLVWSTYKGVAPNEEILGLDTIRDDFQWNVGATLEAPVTEFTSFSTQVMYTSNSSSLSRFTYENLQVMMGPVGKF